MTEKKCWICESKSSCAKDQNLALHYNCERCGDYVVGWETSRDNKLQDARLIANISGWVRENQNVFINNSVFQILKIISTPSVNERADKFLRWLDSQSDYLGKQIAVNITEGNLWAMGLAMNKKEIEYLIHYLHSRKFINKIGQSGVAQFGIEILPDGFSYLDELNRKIQSNLGFCAMSFSDELLPVWNEAISPAIVSAGYDPVRIDSEQYNTGIVDQIKAKIRQAKFVVADLTMHRQGVYYEAGFAEGLGRDVIFTCREDQFDDKHFDVQHMNIIKWIPEQVSDFKKKLHWRIEGTLGQGRKK